jgi:hypothetical protein
MKYRTRTYYTDAQKAVMWERWKQGWDAAPDCSPVRSRSYLGSRSPSPDRGHQTARTNPFCDRADAARA